MARGAIVWKDLASSFKRNAKPCRGPGLILCFCLCFAAACSGALAVEAVAPCNSTAGRSENAAAPWQEAVQPPGNRASQDGSNQQSARTLSVAIDSFVVGRMSELNIPGYSLCVIKDGAVVHRNSYGLANVEMRQPVTSETVFGLASITKTFTALTLLSLVDKGMVGLEDPLEKYLKGLSDLYKGLTIRQLASMTAGVPSKVPVQLPWRRQFSELMTLPLASTPGSQYLYSNHSYRLLGSVIETVTGRPYLEVVGETILGPLGMSMTGTPMTLGATGLVARPYGDRNGTAPLRQISYLSPEISFAAGMLASNVDDLTKYVFGLLNGKIVSAQAYQTLWYDRPPLTTGAPSHWAFGWGSKRSPIYGDKRVLSMNGGIPGVASTIIIIPETNSAVIALCNLRKPLVYSIAQKVARLAFASSQSDPSLSAQFLQIDARPPHELMLPEEPPGESANDFSESESMQNE